MKDKKVFIVGLGLIGGSLAMAIRKSHSVIITGFDIDQDTIQTAVDKGIIDTGEKSITEGATNADLILLAAPIGGILAALQELKDVPMKPDVLITDAGSAKQLITEKAAETLGNRHTFIGGHPMAGSHKSGVSAGSDTLFENAFYFITPNNETSGADIEKLQNWLKGARAKFVTIEPKTHDEVVGVISHFPHIVASGLIHHLKDTPDSGLNLSRLAAGGFRDITRIASSDPTMWNDVVINNREVLLQQFESWERVMEGIKTHLINNDTAGIKHFFEDAKVFRDQFPVKQKGAIPSSFDLYLDIPDRPGEISRVTYIIGDAGISLTNINVIELRENISGVLRISFQTEENRRDSMALLKAKGYKTYLND